MFDIISRNVLKQNVITGSKRNPVPWTHKVIGSIIKYIHLILNFQIFRSANTKKISYQIKIDIKKMDFFIFILAKSNLNFVYSIMYLIL